VPDLCREYGISYNRVNSQVKRIIVNLCEVELAASQTLHREFGGGSRRGAKILEDGFGQFLHANVSIFIFVGAVD